MDDQLSVVELEASRNGPLLNDENYMDKLLNTMHKVFKNCSQFNFIPNAFQGSDALLYLNTNSNFGFSLVKPFLILLAISSII